MHRSHFRTKLLQLREYGRVLSPSNFKGSENLWIGSGLRNATVEDEIARNPDDRPIGQRLLLCDRVTGSIRSNTCRQSSPTRHRASIRGTAVEYDRTNYPANGSANRSDTGAPVNVAPVVPVSSTVT